MEEIRRRLAVLSLRVWLAELSASDKRVRAAYVRWQRGSEWTAACGFDVRDRGGFTALKEAANGENARVRRAGQDPRADADAEAEAVRAELAALYQTGQVRMVKAVPFADAVKVVLAGPHAEAVAPLQAR